MKQTSNYGLNIFEGSEIPNKDYINANNQKIDTVLKEASTHNHDGVNSQKINALNVVFDKGETTLTSTDLNSAIQEVFTEADNQITWGSGIIGKASDSINDPQKRLPDLKAEFITERSSYINRMGTAVDFSISTGMPSAYNATIEDIAEAIENTQIPRITATASDIVAGIPFINKYGLTDTGTVPYNGNAQNLTPSHTSAINITKGFYGHSMTIPGFGVTDPQKYIMENKNIAGVTGTLKQLDESGWNPQDTILKTKLTTTSPNNCFYKSLSTAINGQCAVSKCPDMVAPSGASDKVKAYDGTSLFIFDTKTTPARIVPYKADMTTISNMYGPEVDYNSDPGDPLYNPYTNKPLLYVSNRINGADGTYHKYCLATSSTQVTIIDLLSSNSAAPTTYSKTYTSFTPLDIMVYDNKNPYTMVAGYKEYAIVIGKHTDTGRYGYMIVTFGGPSDTSVTIGNIIDYKPGAYYFPRCGDVTQYVRVDGGSSFGTQSGYVITGSAFIETRNLSQNQTQLAHAKIKVRNTSATNSVINFKTVAKTSHTFDYKVDAIQKNYSWSISTTKSITSQTYSVVEITYDSSLYDFRIDVASGSVEISEVNIEGTDGVYYNILTDNRYYCGDMKPISSTILNGTVFYVWGVSRYDNTTCTSYLMFHDFNLYTNQGSPTAATGFDDTEGISYLVKKISDMNITYKTASSNPIDGKYYPYSLFSYVQPMKDSIVFVSSYANQSVIQSSSSNYSWPLNKRRVISVYWDVNNSAIAINNSLGNSTSYKAFRPLYYDSNACVIGIEQECTPQMFTYICLTTSSLTTNLAYTSWSEMDMDTLSNDLLVIDQVNKLNDQVWISVYECYDTTLPCSSITDASTQFSLNRSKTFCEYVTASSSGSKYTAGLNPSLVFNNKTVGFCSLFKSIYRINATRI